jgi:hypothetical protein
MGQDKYPDDWRVKKYPLISIISPLMKATCRLFSLLIDNTYYLLVMTNIAMV